MAAEKIAGNWKLEIIQEEGKEKYVIKHSSGKIDRTYNSIFDQDLIKITTKPLLKASLSSACENVSEVLLVTFDKEALKSPMIIGHKNYDVNVIVLEEKSVCVKDGCQLKCDFELDSTAKIIKVQAGFGNGEIINANQLNSALFAISFRKSASDDIIDTTFISKLGYTDVAKKVFFGRPSADDSNITVYKFYNKDEYEAARVKTSETYGNNITLEILKDNSELLNVYLQALYLTVSNETFITNTCSDNPPSTNPPTPNCASFLAAIDYFVAIYRQIFP